MALTLGEKLANVQDAIVKTEKQQEMETSDTRVQRAKLDTLYKREEALIKKISQYGSSYVEGSQSQPTARKMNVQFS